MKQLLCLLLALPLVLLAACSDDEKGSVSGDNPLVGIWTEGYESGKIDYQEWLFNEDFTGIQYVFENWDNHIVGNGSPDPFTYVFDEDDMLLYVYFNDHPESYQLYDVNLSGDRLELREFSVPDMNYMPDRHYIMYKSADVENGHIIRPDDDDDPDDSEVGDDYLAGQWMDVDGPSYIFTFSRDKTGTYMHVDSHETDYRSFTYSYNKSKGKLSITFNDNKSPKVITFDIRISGVANSMIELTCTSGNFIDLILIGAGISS